MRTDGWGEFTFQGHPGSQGERAESWQPFGHRGPERSPGFMQKNRPTASGDRTCRDLP